MYIDSYTALHALADEAPAFDRVNDLVMGVHWDPVPETPQASLQPANLDAVCLLLDDQLNVVERVGPDHPRNANSSVVHTGDSRTGAGTWDDERVFVFLDALPQNVHALLFAVVSVDGRALGRVGGAFCHVSDQESERELIRIDPGALGHEAMRGIAMAQRTADGWSLSRCDKDLDWSHLLRTPFSLS
jgi:tellurium resistance protein TerZ